MLESRIVIGLLLGPAMLLAQAGNHGIAPRAKPEDYAAHVVSGDVTYAAAAIPPAQVKKLFAFDISKDYIVFEIAVYPASGTAELTADNFLVRTAKNPDPLRPSDPTTVASDIQQRNLPKRGREGGTTVVAGTEGGYESGRDPYTGQKTHGTYTSTGVGVGTGDDPNAPPRMPSPGGNTQDRDRLENQLWDKMLPDGHFNRAVAGYLYFPASLLKKKSSDGYELEYLSDNEKVKFTVPAK